MNSNEIKETVVIWAEKIGRRAAVRRLILNLEMSSAMAEKLVKGTYSPTPHFDTINALVKEMQKDGFLAGPQAS
jgi:hypothetical protein